jgi:tRNA pseudouridine38-40 synthase
LKEDIKVTGASRTDTGVHARGQVVNFKTSSGMNLERMTKSLNGLLPAGIAVTNAEAVPDEFHARKCAKWREYEYLIWNRPYPDLFRSANTAHISQDLDVGLMTRAAGKVKGMHDFSAFCVSTSACKGCVRNVAEIVIDEPESGLIRLTIRADGFVHRMVRSLTGTLIDIGRGRLEPETIAAMLRTKDRKLAGRTAPANGLTLTGIGY